jgi:hypothetical protein
MAIADDISVSTSGDIRWTGQHHDDTAPTYYTVLELHRYLQGLADDAQASGDDLLDITDSTPSERSTDNIITLVNSYNIDDLLAEHLYDGSVTQGSGNTETQYSGLVVVGSLNDSNTEIQIVQDNHVLSNFWDTGLNTDATQNILLRILVKTREYGVDIDAKKIRAVASWLGDTYAEFNATLGLGNSTAALFTNNDLNNTSNDATIAAFSGITNVEGYQTIDLNNGNGAQPYYSQWNRASQTINDLYEWAKWIQQTGVSETSNISDTGANYTIDDGSTVFGQGQSFDPGANDEKLVKVQVKMKKTGSPTGDIICKLMTHSGTFGTSSIPTSATALATSQPIDAATLTTSYRLYEFYFWRDADVTDGDATPPRGDNQYDLQTGTDYCLLFHHLTGDGSNNVQIDGDATGTHEGNQFDETVADTTWVPAAAEDLAINVFTSPTIHGMSGELFRGITHQFDYSGTTGTVNEDDTLTWGTTFTYTSESGGPFEIGERLDFSASNAVATLIGLQDDGTTGKMVVAVESGTIANTNGITGLSSSATATVNSVPVAGSAEGSGLLLADDSVDTMWIQLLTGAPPVSGQVLRAVEQEGTVTTNSAPTSRTVSPSFMGTSTGSALFGAFGVGVEAADLTSSDSLTDLLNVVQNPPNNVTFTVAALIQGDRVLVGPNDGGTTLQYHQYLLSTALSATNETAVVIKISTTGENSGTIVGDTPTTGTIRIELDSGIYRRVPFTSYTGSTFTIGSTDFSGANVAAVDNNVFISYIDEAAGTPLQLSYTAVYSSDRSLFVRVRDGGGTPIKTFEADGTFASASSTLNAIRTDDD